MVCIQQTYCHGYLTLLSNRSTNTEIDIVPVPLRSITFHSESLYTRISLMLFTAEHRSQQKGLGSPAQVAVFYSPYSTQGNLSKVPKANATKEGGVEGAGVL